MPYYRNHPHNPDNDTSHLDAVAARYKVSLLEEYIETDDFFEKVIEEFEEYIHELFKIDFNDFEVEDASYKDKDGKTHIKITVNIYTDPYLNKFDHDEEYEHVSISFPAEHYGDYLDFFGKDFYDVMEETAMEQASGERLRDFIEDEYEDHQLRQLDIMRGK
jgi:hypothetical protein